MTGRGGMFWGLGTGGMFKEVGDEMFIAVPPVSEGAVASIGSGSAD